MLEDGRVFSEPSVARLLFINQEELAGKGFRMTPVGLLQLERRLAFGLKRSGTFEMLGGVGADVTSASSPS